MYGQAAHKPVADQNMLADQSAKQTEQLRSKNTGIEHTTGLHVRSEKEGRQGEEERSDKRKQAAADSAEHEDTQRPVHPFKGHHVDIKL